MTIEVEVPGGVVEFPDGTPHDVMVGALRAKFGAPAPAAPEAKPPGMSIGAAMGELWRDPPKNGLVHFLQTAAKSPLAPGMALQGQFTPPTETPGVLTEEDAFRQRNAAEHENELAGGLAGLMTGGSLPRVATPNALASGASRLPAAAVARDAVIEAGGRVDAPIPKFMATPNVATQRIAASLKNIPIAGDKIIGATDRLVQGLGSAEAKVAEGYGNASPAIAGSEAKDALANWTTGKSKDVTARVYEAVDPLINAEFRRPLDATTEAVSNIMARRANAGIAGKSAAVDQVLDAVKMPGGLNYQGVKDLRTHVGELTSQDLVTQRIAPKERDAIYAALSQDLKETIRDGGGEPALAAWERANTVAKQVADRRAMLNKIIGAKGDAAPEAVYSRLLAMAGSKSSADIGRLTSARKAMGAEAWDEFASGVVSKLGRDAQGNFSPDRFFTAYGNLSPQGRTTLFKSTGKDDLARALEDINIVVNGVKDRIGKFSNPSGTAQNMTGIGVITGAIHSPLQTMGTLLGGQALAKALSQPATARAVADLVKADAQARMTKSPLAAMAVRAAAQSLANALGAAGITPDTKGP